MGTRTDNEPLFDESMTQDWDEVAAPPSWETGVAHAVLSSVSLGATKSGKFSVEAEFEFLVGPNKGRTARKWVTIQTVSKDQVAIMQRDLLALLSSGVQSIFPRGFGAIKPVEGPKHYTAEPSSRFSSLANSATGRVMQVRVASVTEDGWPVLQIQHYRESFDSVEEYEAQVKLQAKQKSEKEKLAEA